jgi:hypothetical protein
MHISIGAAILILGLLFLATTHAGRMVLLTVALVVGIGGYLALKAYHDEAEERSRNIHSGYTRAHNFISSTPVGQFNY